MENAAMVAGTFKIDPIVVLKSDYFDWAVRLTCTNIYNEKVREEQEKQANANGK